MQLLRRNLCQNLIYSAFIVNLTTVSKNTYVNGFLGSFQTPNLHRSPYNKYVTDNKIRNDLHPPGSEKTPENRNKVNDYFC